MERVESSKNLCEMCEMEIDAHVGYAVQSDDGTRFLRLCATCRREFAMRKAKITPAPTNLKRDLTGKNIGCWFVVAYAGQRDGVHYWRCMSRASLAEKVVAEREILDRKLNVVSEVPDHWTEAEKNPIGWIYGEWTVLGLSIYFVDQFGKEQRFWKCHCICGTESYISKDGLHTERTPCCCGCRSEAEVQETLWWRKRLAREGWKNACDTAKRCRRERHFDKNWTCDMERALCRFQPACVICPATDHLATHHVLPLSRGHGLEPGNAVRLCQACNSFIGKKEPIELSPNMARKLVTAAAQFKEHWESGCATPSPPAAPTKETPQTPDPVLITLLRSIECGEETAIPALADWLEGRGDPRASAIREVAKLVLVVRESQAGAKEAHLRMEFLLDGKRYDGASGFEMRSPADTEDRLALRVKVLRSQRSFEVWRRLGLVCPMSGTLKQYLGINPMGLAATIEEIAQRERNQMQTIRNRIELALHHLSLSVRRVPGKPKRAWRAVVGDAPPDCSKPELRR